MMCTTCGCGAGEVQVNGQALPGHDAHWHVHADGTAHSHAPQGKEHKHAGAEGTAYRHVHAPGISQARMVRIERDILSKNDAFATHNRSFFQKHGILALNLVSSPGSGKTSLLVRTITELQQTVPVAVIEGDQQTAFDAERVRATGTSAIQINTGKGCHLDAHMVGQALRQLTLADEALLFIENVGNLVCPAAFDLGEACKVAILSVTEGEDKPLKYPDMFQASRLMLLNKCDLLPHLAFDIERAEENARRVNPAIEIIRLSATSGLGFDEWLAWIARERAAYVAQQRIAELEAQPAAMRG